MKLTGSALALALSLVSQGAAQSAKAAYPSMAPLSQHLIRCLAKIQYAGEAEWDPGCLNG